MGATREAKTVLYDLEGSLLEACSCGVLCPCWIGEDPDDGSCNSFNAYHFNAGRRSVASTSAGCRSSSSCTSPATCSPRAAGGWSSSSTTAASDEQHAGHRSTPTTAGSGGPLADLAGLVGEVLAVERAPITPRDRAGPGHPRRSARSSAPRWSPSAAPTARPPRCVTRSSPPSPARRPTWPKATTAPVNLPQFGMEWSFEDRNAIQSDYHITYAALSR